jgi:hypothetical protein
MHHHTIQINLVDATIILVLLFDIYLELNIFRAFSRPSSRAQQLQQCCWSLSGRPAVLITTYSTAVTTLGR